MKIGVLALQGAFDAHQRALHEVGACTTQVRTPADLARVDALVMPGGESTTMSRLLVSSGLFDELDARIGAGMPVFGTCAGMILLARDVVDGRPDQRSFGAIDLVVQRNGYGRQVDSFETDITLDPELDDDERSFHAVFIRAPKVVDTGDGVDVLARHEGVPVLVRQANVLAAAFHPELSGDPRVHEAFLRQVGARVATASNEKM